MRKPVPRSRFPSLWASGRVRPAGSAFLGTDERAFRYGDGVFTTMRLEDGRLLGAEEHWAALAAGTAELGLPLPEPVSTPARLGAVVSELAAGSGDTALVRVQISAAPSSRGYAREPGSDSWELVELLEPPPPRRTTVALLADGEVPVPALPRVKACSALAHVLCARAAAERGAHEAVRVYQGCLAESAAANLFWLSGDRLRTPADTLPIYPGVTRGVVLRAARRVGLSAEEGEFPPGDLSEAEGVFLTNSVRGIERVYLLDGREVGWPEVLEALAAAARDVRREESLHIRI